MINEDAGQTVLFFSFSFDFFSLNYSENVSFFFLV